MNNTMKAVLIVAGAYLFLCSLNYENLAYFTRGKGAEKVVFEHNASFKKPVRTTYKIIKDDPNKVDIWEAKDGFSKCTFEMHKPQDGDPMSVGSFDCWPTEWRTQLMIDCEKNFGKEHSVTFFLGGSDKNNQNFEIWCE